MDMQSGSKTEQGDNYFSVGTALQKGGSVRKTPNLVERPVSGIQP